MSPWAARSAFGTCVSTETQQWLHNRAGDKLYYLSSENCNFSQFFFMEQRTVFRDFSFQFGLRPSTNSDKPGNQWSRKRSIAWQKTDHFSGFDFSYSAPLALVYLEHLFCPAPTEVPPVRIPHPSTGIALALAGFHSPLVLLSFPSTFKQVYALR